MSPAAKQPRTLLPSGRVTFLLTDVEGSTRQWEENPGAMAPAMAAHDALVGEIVDRHEGVLVKSRGEGDSAFAAFAGPNDALAAAAAIQVALRQHQWPPPVEMRIRIALHTGEAELRDGDYYGQTVNRAARLRAVAHGGQTVVSGEVAVVVGAALRKGMKLRDLGEHRLRDLARPIRIFQLDVDGLPAEFPPLKSLDARPNNLPVELSTFVGRERDLAELRRLLDAKRLVTITGAGGTGKTRLSLQVAADGIDAFADGTFFVPLASVAEARLVLTEIAQAIGVTEAPGEPLAERVKQHLATREVLMVLDNFEQVIGAAETVADLLGSAAQLKILVTSRAPLRVAGEQEYPVPPLEVPDLHEPLPLRNLVEYDAVRLFSERAAEVRPDFALTTENARSVAEICRRLDGSPLAIELAATRIRLMDADSLLRRLSHALGLLVDGRRDAPARQQSLRGAIAWSHDLLAPKERELFRRLAVFCGGFTLEAAEAICGSDGAFDVLGSLSALVENSLVRQDETATERFAMLGTIREYALEQLASDHDAIALRRRHAEHFLAMAEQARNAGADEREAWRDQLERDRENIRAAIEWAAENGDGDLGLRIAAAAFPFWSSRGHWEEGVTLLRSVLALPTARAATAERGAALDRGARVPARQRALGSGAHSGPILSP